MSALVEDVLIMTGGEEPIAVVQGRLDEIGRATPRSWDAARESLSEPFVLWSRTWVVWVHEYDGATELRRLPRDPSACESGWNGERVDLPWRRS